MTHFKSNLRDIEFNLFELLNRQELLGSAPYEDTDTGTARGILAEVARLAAGPLAESFADADRHPPVYDPATRSVTMPESFARSFRAFIDAEWFRLELPPELGGTAAPRSLWWSVAELVLGANPAIWMYASGAAFAKALYILGTAEQRHFADHPAIGTLVGDVHDGIKQMFLIIEHARMMVGTKAIATLSTGYLNALEYAKTRVQGGELARMTDKTAPRVTIMHHPDVRRILMLQKAYAEGMRALVLFTATFQDAGQLAEAAGTTDDAAAAMNDLLLPLVKGLGSERAYEMLTLSLQTFGGSGYLQDYPMEQYIRDAKIDSLYEGTTAIQGLDLYFRKIIRNKGDALASLLNQIIVTAEGEQGNGRLKKERAALARATADVEAMVNALHRYLADSLQQHSEIDRVGLNTTRLLLALGDLVVGWLLVRQSEIAGRALDNGTASGADTAFYQGKIAAARFFAETVLPRLAAEREIVESTTTELMDLPEAAF